MGNTSFPGWGCEKVVDAGRGDEMEPIIKSTTVVLRIKWVNTWKHIE